MKKTLKNIFSGAILSCLILFGAFLSGCGAKTIELYQEDKTYEIAPGHTLQLTAKSNYFSKEDISYVVETKEFATIDANGLLTANTNAPVGSIIKVYAQAGDVKSNKISVTITNLVPESIKLVSDNTKIAKIGIVNFSVDFKPDYSTVKDYTLLVTKINNAEPTEENKNYASIIDNSKLVLSTEVDVPVGTTFEVTAKINGHESLSSSVVITVVDSEKLYDFTVSNVNYLVTTAQERKVDLEAYNEAGDEINVDLSHFTFTSRNPDIATIAEDGTIVAHSHGEAIIEVKKPGSTQIDKTFSVFVMVPPSFIELDNVSTYINKTSEFDYSKVDALKLDLIATRTNYTACTDKFDYDFKLIGSDGQALDVASNDIATVDSNGIHFSKTGKVKVTIKSNSSLNNFVVKDEVQKELIINVNEGINIKTVEEFKNFANQYDNTVVNFTKDLYLTESENFGLGNSSKYPSLELRGDRTINGNGYVISLEKLPLLNSNERGNDFLLFSYKDVNTPFSVKIYNFEVIGCGGVNGVYSGQLSAEAGKQIVLDNGEFSNTYRRGIRIFGGDYANGVRNTYVKSMEIRNVKASKFDVGIRMEHVVDGYMSDITIQDCFSNGMEFSQCQLTLNDITLGRVGAFGIEITPDDMKDKETKKPAGTAGIGYNETPSLKLTGYIHSDNYNSGASTLYMQGLQGKLGMTVPQLMDGIISATINAMVTNIEDASVKENMQNKMLQVLTQCLKKQVVENGKTVDYMNFYLLIFINKAKFTQYDGGNTEGKFANYTSNGDDNMINVNQILTNLMQNENYDGYKNYQYIQMDLPTGTAMGNIGQVVVVNQAYKG